MSDFLKDMLDISNLQLISSKNILLEQGILTAIYSGSDNADLFMEFGHILKIVTTNYNNFIEYKNAVNKEFKKLSNLEENEKDFNKKCEINQIKVSLILNYPIQIRIYLRTIFIEIRTLYYLRKQMEKYFKKIRHEKGYIIYYSLKDKKENIFLLSKIKEIIDLYNDLLQETNKI